MKKKVFAVLCCMMVAFSVGCSKKETPETPDTPKTDVSTSQKKELTPMEKEEVLPMFEAAADIYGDIEKGRFPLDFDTYILQGEDAYYKVEDKRFGDIDELQKYLQQYFTQSFIHEVLLDDAFLEGKDGGIYMLSTARGSDPSYAGYSVGEPDCSSTSTTFAVTEYFTADGTQYDGEYFSTEPENLKDFKTSTGTFQLVPENSSWKFDSFHVSY